jgi:hypothetical protein
VIPFPGESSAVDRRYNLVGTPVAVVDDIQVRAGSSTFTAGDSVKLVSNLRTFYLDDPAGVSVSWVVEVLSGSGVLSLSEGLRPTSGSGEPAGTSLGSHTVTGPTTLVVPSVAISAGDVFDYIDYGHLHLTCVSGTVEVQQVKLRVWPSAGVAGGWSDLYPSWGAESPVNGRYVNRNVTEFTASSAGSVAEWDAVFVATQTHANEAVDVAPSTNTGALSFQTLGNVNVTEDIFTGDSSGAIDLFTIAVAVARAQQDPGIDPDLGLVEGVDWIVPPNEVALDLAEIVDPTSPDVGREWVNTSVVVVGSTTGSASGPDYGAPSLSVTEYTATDDPFVTLPVSTWPDLTATTLAAGETALSVPDADQLLFAASFSWMVETPDHPGGLNVELLADWVWSLGSGDPVSEDFQRLGVHYTYPSYRVWNPEAVATVRRVVRHGIRNDGLFSTAPRRWGQESSYQTGRVGGHQ